MSTRDVISVYAVMILSFFAGLIINPWGADQLSLTWSWIKEEWFGRGWKTLYEDSKVKLTEAEDENRKLSEILFDERLESYNDAGEIGTLRNKIEEMHSVVFELRKENADLKTKISIATELRKENADLKTKISIATWNNQKPKSTKSKRYPKYPEEG